MSVAEPVAPDRARFSRERKLTAIHVGVAFVGLALGSLFGPLQALEHAKIDLYPLLNPLIGSYYQGLTLHGVLNALVFTTWFITGFLTFATVRSLDRPLRHPWISYLGLMLMAIGLVTAAVPILLNQATVLYTFYAPLMANAFFYIGVTVMVVGSWVVGYSLYATMWAWYKENPGKPAPLIALLSVITMVMWQIATFGVAVEEITMLIPWSLGLIEGVDPQLTRSLFWFTGHPLVYFWLLPAYISWYAMLPRQAGGKLFSDPLARLSFWLFLALSVPLGFHHQYTDPGVPAGWKYLHTILTYTVVVPSLLTIFNLFASLNIAGKARGGKGFIRWVVKLPWGDPSVSAQLLSAIIFLFGGIGGLINAAYNMNLVIHNTAWVPGHLHLTVGTAATLTFIGISYWLIPHLTGRALWSKKLGVAQTWVWFIGMAIFSRGMHLLGILGAPRRTPLGITPYFSAEWQGPLVFVALGGTILFVSGLLLFVNLLVTVFAGKRLPEAEIPDMPVAEAVSTAEDGPAWLSSWKPWLAVTLALILIGYGPALAEAFRTAEWTSPGFRLW